MSEEKKQESTTEKVYDAVNPEGIIKDLTISAAFVHLLQDTLIYVIQTFPKDKNISSSYQRIDQATKVNNASLLDHGDRALYTLTALSQYLRDSAIAQGLTSKVSGIDDQDLENTMKAFLSNNMEKLQEEFQNLTDKVKHPASS